ncbi:hypothetical protein [Zavarzinella formosa]|uniref:hypothetical protein n=1 Tax=Zavarzinella formosa TaxID=360055 RepID=UPI0002F2CDB3|nr:hypothetical protein [Zavarzinella formosa]
MNSSIFLDLALPNATTWFYFSFLLAVTLFVRFDRLLSLRNWDVVAFYLIIPGLLCIQEAHALNNLSDNPAVGEIKRFLSRSNSLLLAGYIWLMSASGYWFLRCLFDLGLEKRPMLPPNVNIAGMVCLAASLFLCLGASAIRRLPDSPNSTGKGPIALTKVSDGAVAVVSFQSGTTDWNGTDTRFWVERAVAIIAHLLVVAAILMIGSKTFGDPLTGIAMACLYLLLPCTGYQVSQVHHIWPALFLLGAVLWFRRPYVSGALLGVAAGSVFFPVLLFPLWFGFYRGRGTGRFTIGFVAALVLSLGITAAILLSSGELRQYLRVALSLSDWQAWKAPRTESIWTGSHWAYRLPVFIAYMAFVILTVFWPKPRHLGHVIAQSAAVVIGVQFWYADQGGTYVLWYVPLLLLMVFRPNLTEVRPPEIIAGNWNFREWVVRRIIRRGTKPV